MALVGIKKQRKVFLRKLESEILLELLESLQGNHVVQVGGEEYRVDVDHRHNVDVLLLIQVYLQSLLDPPFQVGGNRRGEESRNEIDEFLDVV